MKYQSLLKWLILLIGILALIAASWGLFDSTEGQAYSYTNHRGETVIIHAQGLYYYDSVSSAAQMQANDLISLLVGLPLLLISSYFAFRASLRGQILLAGTLGFFLYSYMSMSVLAAYNVLFLLYVALFGLSLYAFLLMMLSFDLDVLSKRFSEHFPHKWIAALLFTVAGFLLLAWLGRILPEMQAGYIASLENTTTRVIQAMDLALICPAAILAAILLLRRQPIAYLLASVLVMKMVTMGLAVSAMGINMAFAGVPDSLGILVPFVIITSLNLIAAVVLLKNIQAQPHSQALGIRN
jgi:hypothetical protein